MVGRTPWSCARWSERPGLTLDGMRRFHLTRARPEAWVQGRGAHLGRPTRGSRCGPAFAPPQSHVPGPFGSLVAASRTV